MQFFCFIIIFILKIKKYLHHCFCEFDVSVDKLNYRSKYHQYNTEKVILVKFSGFYKLVVKTHQKAKIIAYKWSCFVALIN